MLTPDQTRPFLEDLPWALRSTKTFLEVLRFFDSPLEFLVQPYFCFFQLLSTELPKIDILQPRSTRDVRAIHGFRKEVQRPDKASSKGCRQQRVQNIVPMQTTTSIEEDQNDGAECNAAGRSLEARGAVVFGMAELFVLSRRILAIHVFICRRVR